MVGDGRGVTRPENDNNTVFTSPISKKFIQKSRSVSDIRKSFLEEKSGVPKKSWKIHMKLNMHLAQPKIKIGT